MSLHTLIDTVENVTLGVIDKNPQLKAELHGVTFSDVFGGIHTVFAHKDGPFANPDDVIKAFEDGVLHTFESHEQAAQFERDRGNHETADKLDALGKPAADVRDEYEGSRF